MELNQLEPAERFLRGKPEPRRQVRRRWTRRGLVWIFVALGAFLTIGVLGWLALAARPEFALNRIWVEGNARLSEGEILELLELGESPNVLTLELNEVRQMLMRSAWVKDVEITRMLPATLTLSITERVPVGIAVLDSLYLLADDGSLLDQLGPHHAAGEWILIQGLMDESGIVPERARLAGRLARELSQHPQLLNLVSELDVSEGADSIRLHLRRPRLTVLVRADSSVTRLLQMAPLAEGLVARFKNSGTLDLRFRDRAFLRTRVMNTDGASSPMSVGGESF